MLHRLVPHQAKAARGRRATAGALRMQQRLQRSQGACRAEDAARHTEQLTHLARHLQAAREDERARLARDLHDELGALLTAARLDAARIRPRLAGGPPQALDRLDHLVGVLDSVVGLTRRITEDLRPSSLAHLGLVHTLQTLASEFTQRSGLPVHCALQPVGLCASADLVAYRLVQEAINNISKHARARQVWLTLAPCQGRVRLAVRDDGVGFAPQRPGEAGFGLLGMRVRVQAEQGELSVASAPGQGSCVQALLPVSGPVPALP